MTMHSKMKNIWTRSLSTHRKYGLMGVIHSVRWRFRMLRTEVRSSWRQRWCDWVGVKKVGSPYGVDFAPNWRDLTFRFYVNGAYGTGLADLLSEQDSPFFFIDIGANQGLYSILAARNPQCRKAISLEPIKDTFETLKKNIILNGVSAHVVALPWAISNRRGNARVSSNPNHSGASSLERWSDGQKGEVVELHEFSDLEQYVSGEMLPIFVKIDVEGHEPSVISSIAQSTQLCPRISDIVYEVDERWVSVPELRRKLENIGFKQFTDIGSGAHRDVHAEK